MIPVKLYAYGALIIALLGGGFWFNAKLNENKRLKVDIAAAELSRDTAIASSFLYQQNNERQTKLISDYQVKLDEKQNINSALERDVAAGRRKLSVRGASCSASTATTDTSSANTYPVFDSEFRSNIFSLRSGIIKLEENYALCLQTLINERAKY